MATETFKAPKVKKTPMKRDPEAWMRKRKVKNRFLNFCDIVLEYTQYEHMKQEELRSHSTSPLDSGGSTAESFTSDSLLYNHDEDMSRSHLEPSPFLSSPESTPDSITHPKDDSWESITCFCRKPFSGRPMIECNKCLTWIHLSCAKIRRNNIPEEFTCQKCRELRNKKRKSNRMRIEHKMVTPPQAPVVSAMS